MDFSKTRGKLKMEKWRVQSSSEVFALIAYILLKEKQ